MSKILLIIAFVLLIFALVVASGTAFLTNWAVWLCSGLAAWVLSQLAVDLR